MSNQRFTQCNSSTGVKINPKSPGIGIDHWNLDMSNNHPLCRQLDFRAKLPFVHPDFGQFESIEGFIYYLITREQKFRTGHGIMVRTNARRIPMELTPEQKEYLQEAIGLRFLAHPDLYASFMAAPALPYTMYYIFSGTMVKDISSKYMFLLKELTNIRNGKPHFVKSRSSWL